jgi:hypothetical protein
MPPAHTLSSPTHVAQSAHSFPRSSPSPSPPPQSPESDNCCSNANSTTPMDSDCSPEDSESADEPEIHAESDSLDTDHNFWLGVGQRHGSRRASSHDSEFGPDGPESCGTVDDGWSMRLDSADADALTTSTADAGPWKDGCPLRAGRDGPLAGSAGWLPCGGPAPPPAGCGPDDAFWAGPVDCAAADYDPWCLATVTEPLWPA